MNYHEKTKDELIKELQELQKEHNSLKASYEKDITERKRVDAALKFTRMILDNAPDTMACMDYDGRYVDINDAFCRSVGFSREELLSMTVHDIDPNYTAEVWPGFMEKLKQSGSLTFESLHRTKEGKLIPVEIRTSFFEHNGKGYHCGFARDITERKQSEEALLEIENRYQELMEWARDAIFSLTPQGLFGSMNQAFEDITGWQTQEWIGKPYTDLLHPEDIPLAAERFSNILKGHTAQAIELRIRKKSGDYAYTEVLASPRMEKGMIIGLLGIGRDITWRKKAEEALRKSEEQYRRLFERASLGIFQSTPEGKAILVNPSFARMFGYDSPKDVMQSIENVTTDLFIDPNRRAEIIRLMAEQPDLRTFENLYRRKDGSSFIGSLNTMPIRDSDGRLVCIEGIIEDITKRKQADEELRKSKELFEKTFSSQRDAIFILDAKTPPTIIDCNPVTMEIFGYTGQEMLGLTTAFLHVDEIALRMFQERLQSAIAERGFLHMPEFEMRRKDGTIFATEHSVMPLKDEKGNRIGWVSVVRDISARKRAEDDLRQSEMKLKTLFKVLPIGVSILNAERNVVFVNPALERILNVNKDGFIRGDYKNRKYLRPDGTQMPEEEFAGVRAIREQRTIRDVETGVLMEDGNVIWTNVNAAPVTFPDWKVVIITTDISERKLAEETLHESEERFRRLSQSLFEGIIIHDEGKIIDANEAFTVMFGYDLPELIGKNALDFATPELREIAERHIRTGPRSHMRV